MPNPRVLLKTALVDGSSLRQHVQTGIAAMLHKDRQLIALTERSKVGDSLDFDEATRVEHPQATRWDYLLSVPSKAQIVALEPHTATDAEVKVVIAKKQHAVDYLRTHLPPKYRVTKWMWVCHGRVGFSRMDRATRLLDQKGISFEGHIVRSLA